VLEIKHSKLQDQYNKSFSKKTEFDPLIEQDASSKAEDGWQASVESATDAFSSYFAFPQPPKGFPKRIREMLQDLVLGTFSRYELEGLAFGDTMLSGSVGISGSRFEWANLREWLEAKREVGRLAVSNFWESAGERVAYFTPNDVFGAFNPRFLTNDVISANCAALDAAYTILSGFGEVGDFRCGEDFKESESLTTTAHREDMLEKFRQKYLLSRGDNLPTLPDSPSS